MKNMCLVLAISYQKTLIWKSGIAPGAKPDIVEAPIEHKKEHELRAKQRHMGHELDIDTKNYYKSITEVIQGTDEVLLIGHGKGKADSMLKLTQYWERRHPELAKKVIGSLNSNLVNLSDAEIMALARVWFEDHAN